MPILCTVIVTDINVSDISFGIEFCSPDNHGMALGIGTGKIVSGKSDGLIIRKASLNQRLNVSLDVSDVPFATASSSENTLLKNPWKFFLGTMYQVLFVSVYEPVDTSGIPASQIIERGFEEVENLAMLLVAFCHSVVFLRRLRSLYSGPYSLS